MAAYIGKDRISAADRFLDAAREAFDFYSRVPLLGAEYPTKNERLKGMRVFRVKGFPNHLAFYFPRDDGIEVVRILHGARDLDAALRDE